MHPTSISVQSHVILLVIDSLTVDTVMNELKRWRTLLHQLLALLNQRLVSTIKLYNEVSSSCYPIITCSMQLFHWQNYHTTTAAIACSMHSICTRNMAVDEIMNLILQYGQPTENLTKKLCNVIFSTQSCSTLTEPTQLRNMWWWWLTSMGYLQHPSPHRCLVMLGSNTWRNMVGTCTMHNNIIMLFYQHIILYLEWYWLMLYAFTAGFVWCGSLGWNHAVALHVGIGSTQNMHSQ